MAANSKRPRAFFRALQCTSVLACASMYLKRCSPNRRKTAKMSKTEKTQQFTFKSLKPLQKTPSTLEFYLNLSWPRSHAGPLCGHSPTWACRVAPAPFRCSSRRTRAETCGMPLTHKALGQNPRSRDAPLCYLHSPRQKCIVLPG